MEHHFLVCAQMAGEANLRAKGLSAVGAGDGAGSLRLQGFFLPLLPTFLSRDDFVGLMLASTATDECSPLCSFSGFFLPCVRVDPKGLKAPVRKARVTMFFWDVQVISSFAVSS